MQEVDLITSCVEENWKYSLQKHIKVSECQKPVQCGAA